MPERPAGEVRIARLPITHPDAAVLVEQVQEEYVARYGGRDETPSERTMFEAPRGGFFGLDVDEVPLATGAWRLRGDVEAFGTTATAEVKRMYVAPAGRGRGLARRMLAHLEETAHRAGAEVAILETGTAQPEAIALYASSGYRPIPGFGHYRDSPLSRCFAIRLPVVQ